MNNKSANIKPSEQFNDSDEQSTEPRKKVAYRALQFVLDWVFMIFP